MHAATLIDLSLMSRLESTLASSLIALLGLRGDVYAPAQLGVFLSFIRSFCHFLEEKKYKSNDHNNKYFASISGAECADISSIESTHRVSNLKTRYSECEDLQGKT